MRLYGEFRKLEEQANRSDLKTHEKIKEEVYSLIEDSLLSDAIALGSEGVDWDEEREEITTIVFHHTKNPSGMTLDRLNAMHLIRLYAARYASADEEPDCRGRPIWSNHLRHGRQVFWGYHWLIRRDGSLEWLLPDESIAWHAGDWEVNKRSIAISIDDDLSYSQPSETVIRACASLIRDYYPQIAEKNILGHCQIKENRIAPGELFMRNWREKLLVCIKNG